MMSTEKTGNFLEENKDLQKTVYDDLGHESAKKFGIALADVIEWSMPWIYKIRLANAKKRLTFENSMKRLANEIGAIDENNLIQIPAEISEPVIEKLTYTTNENVANLFINLLAAAANEKTVGMAHPSFVEMISRMSADEAKILVYLKDREEMTYLHLKANYKSGGGYSYYYKHLSGVEDYAN